MAILLAVAGLMRCDQRPAGAGCRDLGGGPGQRRFLVLAGIPRRTGDLLTGENCCPIIHGCCATARSFSLAVADIVPGDILVLAEGDNIPADARVVEEFGLRVNNAALTGEALPVRKSAEASARLELTEVERPNLVFAGTSVASGTARAVVYSTGSLTQFGRIARMTQETPARESRLQKEMHRITRTFTLAALGIGALSFAWGVWQEGIPWLSAFLLAIGIIVAVIPEGLVPTLTLSLAIAVQRLARHGVLVKSLAMMETVGTTSVDLHRQKRNPHPESDDGPRSLGGRPPLPDDPARVMNQRGMPSRAGRTGGGQTSSCCLPPPRCATTPG